MENGGWQMEQAPSRPILYLPSSILVFNSSFREQLRNLLLTILPRLDAAEDPFLVDQEHGRNAVDAPLLGQRVPVDLRVLVGVEKLRPGHVLVLRQKSLQLIGVAVARDAQDFQALGVVVDI